MIRAAIHTAVDLLADALVALAAEELPSFCPGAGVGGVDTNFPAKKSANLENESAGKKIQASGGRG